MQETITQMEEIEKNVKNVTDPETLAIINKKYRDLQEKLDKLINNINVINENIS